MYSTFCKFKTVNLKTKTILFLRLEYCRVLRNASQQAGFPFLQTIMTCLLLTVNSKQQIKKIFLVLRIPEDAKYRKLLASQTFLIG